MNFCLKELKKDTIFALAIRQTPNTTHWRVGRVVECGSLENC